jgi:PAS domain S-box-containing protein
MRSTIERTDPGQSLMVLGDKSPVGVCVIQEGRFRYVNPVFVALTGYSADELEGSDALGIVAAEDRELVRENAIKMLRGESGSPSQFGVICKDGSTRWVVQTVNSIEYRGKRATLVHCMDFTERRQAEQALAESEERYRTLFERTSSPILVIDADGNYVDANYAALRFLECTRKELTTRNVRDYSLLGSDQELREEHRRMWVEGGRIDTEHYVNGKLKILDLTITPAVWRGQRVVFGVGTDVTERRRAEEALEQSEQNYRALFDSSIVGMFVIDAETMRVLTGNQVAMRTFGFASVEDGIGTNPLDFIPADDRERTLNIMARDMFERDLRETHEFRVITKEGREIWISAGGARIMHQGKLMGLISFTDITDRKRMEETLRRSEERYRTILDEMEEGYYELDLAGNLTFANDAVCRLLGYSRDELVGMNYRVYAPEDEVEWRYKVWNEVYRTGKPTKWLPLENLRKDGTRISVEDSVFAMHNARGQTIGFRGVSRDISERERAEAALRHSEERYRAILEEMEDSYFEVDLGGHLTFVNSATCRNLGYSKEELLGMSYKAFTVQQDIESVFRVFNEVYWSGKPNKGFSWNIISGDGSPWFVDTSVSPLRDGNGEIIGFRGIARDITERKQAEQALRESEERYRSLVNNVNQGIFRSTPGPEGRFLEVNPALEEITGYSREELLRIDVAELYHNATERDEAIRELESAHPAFHRKTRCRKKDGSDIVVSETTVPVRDDQGRALYFDGILEDITERERAEEALKLQTTHFQQLFMNSPDAIVMLDNDERVIQANRGFEKVFGYSVEEVIGRPINELIIPEHGLREAAALSRAVKRGRFVREEEVRRRKDGSLIDVSIVGYPLNLEDKLMGIYVIYSDISKRKKMEKDIRQAAEEWRETFDSITDAVSIHSNDFRLCRVNRAFADRFGMSPHQIVGKHCYEIVHGTKEPVPGCPHRETLHTGRPAGAEFLESENGICLELSTSPIFDERGEVTGTIHIARDITERKQQSLQLMLTDRLASIGELAAGTAHELNNPLTSVIGFSQLLMERDVPDDIHSDLQLIHSEARRAAEVTKNLLTFARKHAPVKQPNRINVIVEDVLRLRAYEQKLNNIQVIKQFASGLPEIVVDYFQIQQVLLNLIINAEYFMTEAHKGGTLTISARRRNSTMIISVADDGPGIPQENLALLFNPFFTTKTAGKGTGLGLSICHGIVTEHGGRIYARSQLGKGTTFFVELPINNSKHNGGTS